MKSIGSEDQNLTHNLVKRFLTFGNAFLTNKKLLISNSVLVSNHPYHFKMYVPLAFMPVQVNCMNVYRMQTLKIIHLKMQAGNQILQISSLSPLLFKTRKV